ncbi:MAG: helix-turn-helix transcriptional regulator [Clostridia bacterium]|nr:helix-turn-helix transcriptional regulator [Clostridia bacterium]
MAEKKTFRDLLKERDINGSQLARKLGVDRALVSCWVTGKTRPTLDMIPKIAKELNLTVEEVLNFFVEV